MYIIFNGPPGSGKDQACSFLQEEYKFKHLRMKDQLFIDTVEYYGVDLDWFMSDYSDRIMKETPRDELNGLSKRQALIHVSEKVKKPLYGKDYYGKQVLKKIDFVSSYCFSDGGFVEEIFPLINTIESDKICLVQLYRYGCSFSSDSRTYIHGNLIEDFGFPGENNPEYKPDIPIRMYRICNNSSISDFHKNIRKIIRKEANVINTKISNLSGKSL